VIGWRPYLLTTLALVLLALMVLDVVGGSQPAPKPDPCAPVAALSKAGFHREASKEYERVLEATPDASCTKAGPFVPTVTTP
jgi:hypothetical protein